MQSQEYNMGPKDLEFLRREVWCWIEAGYCREASGEYMRAMRRVSPEFVTVIAMMSFLEIEYSLVNVAKRI
jgi:hypothetical protein